MFLWRMVHIKGCGNLNRMGFFLLNLLENILMITLCQWVGRLHDGICVSQLKLIFFLCCFMLNMLHLWMNLVDEWTWNRLCPCQAETKNITHLFLYFPLASQVWNYISLWPDLQVPCFYMPSEMFCCIDALPVIRMEKISVESVFYTTIRCFGRIGMWLSFGPQNIGNSLSLIILLIFLFVGLFSELKVYDHLE